MRQHRGTCDDAVFRIGRVTRELAVDAVIFDLDGVLVDSREVVDTAWMHWACEHGLDPEAVLRFIPGKRTRDAVAVLAPHLDADVEAARIVAEEAAIGDRVTPIPGARALLEQLPAERWAIATSGTTAIARPRLRYAGMPEPAIFITADVVRRGKPDPEAYERAAAGLGVPAQRCAVFEDAPSGVAAAQAAGCTVIGVLTWAQRHELGASCVVADLRDVSAVHGSHGITLRFANVPAE